MPRSHIVLQAVLEHGNLPPSDADLLLQNARLTCQSWRQALAPHAKFVRADAGAAAAAAFPCARTVAFDLRRGGAASVDPDAARAIGASLWRTLTTVRILDDDGGDDESGSSSDEDDDEADTAPPPPQQPQPHPHPRLQHPPPPARLLPLTCVRPPRTASVDDDLNDLPGSPTPQQLRRWIVAEVARGAAAAAAAAAAASSSSTTPPALSLDLAGGPLPRPRELRRLLYTLSRPPRALRLAAPTDTARRLSTAHVSAASSSSSSSLETLELVFRSAEGVPARPLVLFRDGNATTNLKRLALTYTGPPELAGSVQAFDDKEDGDDDDEDNAPRHQPKPPLSHLALDMVALPLLPRVFTPLSPHLTTLRLRQREPFTAAEASLIGSLCPGLVALSLSPLPWGLVPLAVGRRRLRELDLGIVDGRGGGGGGADDDGDADDDDNASSSSDSGDSMFMRSPAPRLARAPGSVLGLGLTASRTGSLLVPASSLAAPSLTATTTTASPATAALLKALRHTGAHLTFLAVDATRPLSLRPVDVAAMGRACPRLQALELGVRLENGTAGFGAAFPGLRSLSVRGARSEASDAWSPAEWSAAAAGGSDDTTNTNWSFWSRAPRHRRAVTDPVVLVPADLPPTLESLEARDVWACVPAATLEGATNGGDGDDSSLLQLPTPRLRRLSLRYVGACPGCAPPLPVLRWPGTSTAVDPLPARRSASASSSGGNNGATTTTAPPSASFRDWLLRPLLTLAEAALSPNKDNDDDEDDDDNDAERDQQQRRSSRGGGGGGGRTTTAPPAPTLTFLPANAVLPSLMPSSAARLTDLELALPCDGPPCCACAGGSSCAASRGPPAVRRRSSFTAAGGAAAAADAASLPPLPPPLARAASSGPLAAMLAKKRTTTTTSHSAPPQPQPLKLTLHLPRAARRALSSSPDATAAHLSRALSAALPRALALAGSSSSSSSSSSCRQLRLLCHGDVRCGGELGRGCAGKEAALLRESAVRRLAAMTGASASPSVVVDFVHDPLPHLSGFRGMQCSCRRGRG